MKKFIVGYALLKLFLLAAFFTFSFTACQTAKLSGVEPTPTATPPNSSSPQTNDNINRSVSEPYRGDLSIFEGEERAKNLQIDRVMDILKISEGKNVADIGAGSGWFTVRAAKRVGGRGKVFAVEINQDYINHINDRAKKENFANIQTVLGTEDNTKLAANSVDAVLILKTYHEIAQPIKVLQNIRKSLKKDALVGIIDKNGEGHDHGIDKEKVIEEAKRAGFVLKEEFDFTKDDGMDYFLVFHATK
ncbi:MAG: class I SAM-dependent methyltransferase [Acidobacteria bacterium]|nr:class I SAM-dependent methyltransferase [Acidobacteriota bacterium]MCA1636880.1 class I SAM-dependent methyltransferase [Acidobacteriota bacterium]